MYYSTEGHLTHYLWSKLPWQYNDTVSMDFHMLLLMYYVLSQNSDDTIGFTSEGG